MKKQDVSKWNIQKLKDKDLNWFKKVYKDFVKRGITGYPEQTDAELKNLYNEIISEKKEVEVVEAPESNEFKID